MSAEQTGDSSVAQTPKRRGGPLRWLAGLITLIFLAIVLAAGVAAGSFLRFSNDVIALTPPTELDSADGIVVLTGASKRIGQAVQLLDDGNAKRLLITGVYPTTTGERIQQLTSAEPALFECCVDIGYEALDTRGNANEAALWIRENGYQTVIVVTSNYHMPRSLMELSRVSADTRFIPYPVVSRTYEELEWLRDQAAMRMLVQEYGKFIVARLRHEMGQKVADGLRSSVASQASPSPAEVAGGN